ncbi:MAG TPA: cysteine hydrolase [Polyangia bacterium]|nr:cysteine hydrolase [Polyangia bacterium]
MSSDNAITMVTVDRARTALLLMDFQAEVVPMFERAPPAMARAVELAAAARAAGLAVIYVTVGFRPGYPEVSPRNATFAPIVQGNRMVLGTPGAEVASALRPAAGDVVVVKHRVSAFAGTDLEIVLRAKGIETLILSGVATSGVVLSTLRHAADADYRLIVVEDACADRDEEVHRVLTGKVFPRQATVTTTAEVVAALAGA